MRWNRLIKVGSTLYLTDTGLVGGNRLITSVDGLAGLRGTYDGPVVIPITGAPFEFVAEIGPGSTFSISAEMLMTDTLIDSLVTLKDTSKSTNVDTTFVISDGPEGTKTLNCRWGQPDARPFEYGGVFIDTGSDKRVPGFRMNLTISSMS